MPLNNLKTKSFNQIINGQAYRSPRQPGDYSFAVLLYCIYYQLSDPGWKIQTFGRQKA